MSSDLSNLMSGMAPLITAQFKDVCTLECKALINVDGQMIEDEPNSIVVPNIRLAFEPWRYKGEFLQLNHAEARSGAITHKLLMALTATTSLIKDDYVILVQARDGIHPALRFEQPVRLDESLSPLIIIGATLRNQ